MMMNHASPSLDSEQHTAAAKQCFNHAWELLDRSQRTQDQCELLLHAAHASAYHWMQVGKPVNFARSHWQLSRVYAVLGCADRSLHHARRCLAICDEHHLTAFDRAFAHEALARACACAGNTADAQQHIEAAQHAAADISDADDRTWLQQNIESIAV